MRTEWGTRAEEFVRMLGNGPPYLVRFAWAGGHDPNEQALVTAALASCFGVHTLPASQFITGRVGSPEGIGARVRYLFWTLRSHDLSLGFTHGCVPSEELPSVDRERREVGTRLYRVTLRIDPPRARGYKEV